jgi:tRNA G10  N-methylase Trm11
MGFPDWFFTKNISHTVTQRSSEFLSERRHSTQLVLTSPPDLHESTCSGWPRLFEMYDLVFTKCIDALKDDGVFCVIVTDRKWKGQIIGKHQYIASIAQRRGMKLFVHKILVRTSKIDLYRLGFSHVLCFRKATGLCMRTGAYRSPQFQRDIWGPFRSVSRVPGNRNSFSPDAARSLVEAFSNESDVVLDPFCGTGVTQRVALGLGRRTKGYEINSDMQYFWRAFKNR